MRTIKFRAWTGSKMVYNTELFDYYAEWGSGSLQAREMFPDAGINEYQTYPLMQYTGLTDKNGKEIYEGDVLTAKYAGSSQPAYKNQVVWDGAEYGFSFANAFANAPLWTWEDIEVIGNVFENPELLK